MRPNKETIRQEVKSVWEDWGGKIYLGKEGRREIGIRLSRVGKLVNGGNKDMVSRR